MSGLVLKLGPKERILVNGAVIENGDRRSKLNIVTPNANILRLRDAIHPDEIDSPVKRVCYTLQLVLSGDAEPEEASPQILKSLDQLGQIFKDEESQVTLNSTIKYTKQSQFYPALRSLRHLLGRERMVLEAMN